MFEDKFFRHINQPVRNYLLRCGADESGRAGDTDTLHRQERQDAGDQPLSRAQAIRQAARAYADSTLSQGLGYFPNLDEPQRFSEKVLWLSIYYRNPKIAEAVDKSRIGEWTRALTGRSYAVPVLSTYREAADVDPSKLPRRFVLKQNGSAEGRCVMLVSDSRRLDWDRVRTVLSSWLYSWSSHGYAYPGITDEVVKPCLIAEQYLTDGNGSGLTGMGLPVPTEYRFFCGNGEPLFAQILMERGTAREWACFVRPDWTVLPFTYRNADGQVRASGKPDYASQGGRTNRINRIGRGTQVDQINRSGRPAPKPDHLDEMLRVSRALSAGFPLMRVDFYEAGGRIYVGGTSTCPGLGRGFTSMEWEQRLGEQLVLPEVSL